MLACFLYNTFGYYAVFSINRSIVRAEMRKILEQKKKQVITITLFSPERDPSFRRIHSREFEYKGQMFDVVKESREGNVVTFQCVHDVKESLLVEGLRKASRSRATEQLLQHLITIALPVSSMPVLIPEGVKMHFPAMTAAITGLPFNPLDPPPRQA